MTCTTHHHACECREAAHAAALAQAAAEVERLRRALGQIRDVGLGLDHGSAQWQIDVARKLARAALGAQP